MAMPKMNWAAYGTRDIGYEQSASGAARPSSEHPPVHSIQFSELALTSEYNIEWIAEKFKFLAHLPPDTHEYRYAGFQDLEEVVNQEYLRYIDDNQSPFVVFTGVPPDEVDDRKDFPGRIDYNSELQILTLSVLAAPHEAASSYFASLLFTKASSMSIRRSISMRGATCVTATDRKREAHQSWAPRPLPPGRTVQWPTVVLEVGFSETREKLKHDATYWLNKSEGDIRLTITIDIKRPSGNIYVASWKRTMPTKQVPFPEPEVAQELNICRAKDNEPLYLFGDDLVVPFEQLMLRAPCHGEEDFIFTKEELVELA